MNGISVLIPHKGSAPYTLYAYGIIDEQIEETEGVRFTFSSTSTVILFYTYPHHRRAYVITKKEISYIKNVKVYLPHVLEPTYILFKARGRSVDKLKNAIFHLEEESKGMFYIYPISFFYRLFPLIQTEKASRYNISLFVKEYKERSRYVQRIP
jgi:hypothetical protein